MERNAIVNHRELNSKPGVAPGERFERLTVVSYVGLNKDRRRVWKCKCDCGKEKTASEKCLKRGLTKSCGCLALECRTKHGYAPDKKKSKEYSIYHAMKSRCLDPKRCGYELYGGVGIKVCDRWMESFENFIADMGDCPGGCSIDRIDSKGNYEPSNCRWATIAEQSRNKSSNIFLEYNGDRMCIRDWSNKLKIPFNTLAYRVKKWKDAKRVIETPVNFRCVGKNRRKIIV